jgi:hypothetical protein
MKRLVAVDVIADGHSPLGSRRLSGLCRAVRQCPEGERHNRVLWAAKRAAQLTTAGHLGLDGKTTLWMAVVDLGRDLSDSRRAFEDGWRWGWDHPDPSIPPVWRTGRGPR